MNPSVVFPKQGTPVTITTARPGTPNLTFRGEFIGYGRAKTDYGMTQREYATLRRSAGVSPTGAPVFVIQHIPLDNVLRCSFR